MSEASRPVVSAVLRDLGVLESKLRERGVPEEWLGGLRRARLKLSGVRAPVIASRGLIEAYTYVQALIGELQMLLDSGAGLLDAYVLLNEVSERLDVFAEAARRSYVREKIQLSIPLVMAVSLQALSLLSGFKPPSVLSILVLAAGAVAYYFNTLAGLVFTAAGISLGIASTLVLYGGMPLDELLLELIVLLSAILHIYILLEAGGVQYRQRVSEVLKALDTIIMDSIKPSDPKALTGFLSSLLEQYKGGSIAELARYKAVVMLMNGYSIEEVRRTLQSS